MPEDELRAFLSAIKQQLDQGFQKIKHCVEQLDSEQLWWRPRPEMNSIANLLLHLSGNIRQWLIVGLEGSPDLRQRQLEFDDRSFAPSAELMAKLENTLAEAKQVIDSQTQQSLLHTRRVQEFDIDGFQTILDSVGHFSGHVQEIIHMTRFLKADRYRFYFVPQEHKS